VPPPTTPIELGPHGAHRAVAEGCPTADELWELVRTTEGWDRARAFLTLYLSQSRVRFAKFNFFAERKFFARLPTRLHELSLRGVMVDSSMTAAVGLSPPSPLNALADVATDLFVSLPDSPQGRPIIDCAEASKSPATFLRGMRKVRSSLEHR
jgi:hypothetical protein